MNNSKLNIQNLALSMAEYALRDINKPIGISEYQITKSLPNNLKATLPTIEEIEENLEND